MDDRELIQAYAAEKSEAAFRQLVERYAGLVHASALRQVRDAQLAQDVAQSVFILLARKAGSLKQNTVLAGWLFNTTRFVAARAVRSEQRRQQRELEAHQMKEVHSPNDDWLRIEPMVDEALVDLSQSDREAILLRFFQEKSLREAGAVMGITEEAAKKRVSRALERLREAMQKRGAVLSVGALAAAMTAQAGSVPSAALVSQLAGAALASQASSGAVALTAEVLRGWFWTKFAWTAGVTAIVVASVAWLVNWQNPQTALKTDTVIAGANTAETVAQNAAHPEQSPAITNSDERILRLRVVGLETGEAITNARVAQNYVTGPEHSWLKRYGLKTDANGVCVVPFPKDTLRLDVAVFAPGWSTRSVVWPSEGLSGIPDEYTLRISRVTNSIGGFIREGTGRPVANVEIWFSGNGTGDSAHRERMRERFGFFSAPVATTDVRGHWSVSFVPPANPGFQIEAKHPDFSDTRVAGAGPQQTLSEIQEEELKQLWAGELVTVMNPSITLAGTVLDQEQQPIPGAKIQYRGQSEVFETDANGIFRVPKLKPGEWPFTVSANGFAPMRTNAVMHPGLKPVVVNLQTGAVLRVHLVDEIGADVVGATVGMEQWGPHRGALEWAAKTDRNGRIEWDSAPRDMEIELYAVGDEHCYTRDVRVKADGSEHEIRIRHKLDVYGLVVDAGTGKGISDFKVMPAYGPPDRFYDSALRWELSQTLRSTNGSFKLTFNESVQPWQLRVMAEGYEDWVSPPLTNYMQLTLDIPLKRSVLQNSVRGVVLQTNGEPASGVQVALLSFEHNVKLRNRAFEGNQRWMTRTAADGTFQFLVNPLAHSVAAVSAEGYVLRHVPDPREPVTLQLQSWGRVEVTVDDSARSQPVETIELYDPTADNYQGRVSLLGSYSVKSNENGQFIFEFVPPGEFHAFIQSGLGITYHHGTPVSVVPNETTRITIRESPGTLVKGRLSPVPKQLAQSETVILHFNPDPIVPARFQESPSGDRLRKEFEFWSSSAAREYMRTNRQTHAAKYNPDGTFVSLGRLPAGRYTFIVNLKNSWATQKIEIPEGEDSTLDLGEIKLR